jgi:hypothetical protein
VLAGIKHTSLSRRSVDYRSKKFYNVGRKRRRKFRAVLVDLDGGVDLPDEEESRVEADGACEQPGVEVIKHFSSSSRTTRQSMVECLSLSEAGSRMSDLSNTLHCMTDSCTYMEILDLAAKAWSICPPKVYLA